MKKVIAIIQARMGSSRFPGKVLAQIAGKPMLWHVLNRVQKASFLNQVVVAIPDGTNDDPIAHFCNSYGVECFRGSETDVLDRYYHTAKKYDAEVIYRVTADCPFISPISIDKIVLIFLKGGYHYVHNKLDGSAFSFQSLKQAWMETAQPFEREHVVPYFLRSGKFKLHVVNNDFDMSSLEKIRWYVNERSDLEYVRRIYDEFFPEVLFTLKEIIELVDKRPDIKCLFDQLFG